MNIKTHALVGLLAAAMLTPFAADAAKKPTPTSTPVASQTSAVVLTGVAAMRNCLPTAVIPTRNYPGADAIPTINAMTQPAGKAVAAQGQTMLVTGRVLDAACVPIMDAAVELWQNDPYGRWILADGSDLVNPNPVFTGAGRTYTDNRGIFHFITLFPAAQGVRAPNFNVKVEAPDLHDFSTVLYFAGDARNMADPSFNRLPPGAQQTVSVQVGQGTADMLSGTVTIVLPGRVKYRGY